MRVGIEFTRTRLRNQRYPIFIHTSTVTGAGNIYGDFLSTSVANGVFVDFFPWRSMDDGKEELQERYIQLARTRGSRPGGGGGTHSGAARPKYITMGLNKGRKSLQNTRARTPSSWDISSSTCFDHA